MPFPSSIAVQASCPLKQLMGEEQGPTFAACLLLPGALGGKLLTLFYKQGNIEAQSGYITSPQPHSKRLNPGPMFVEKHVSLCYHALAHPVSAVQECFWFGA